MKPPLQQFLVINRAVALALLQRNGILTTDSPEEFRLYALFDGETFRGLPLLLCDTALRTITFSDRLFKVTLKKTEMALRAVKHVGWVGLWGTVQDGRACVGGLLNDPPSFMVQIISKIPPVMLLNGVELEVQPDYTIEVRPLGEAPLFAGMEQAALIRRRQLWVTLQARSARNGSRGSRLSTRSC